MRNVFEFVVFFGTFSGNPNDKILYGRSGKRRSASFPAARSLERRGSGRLWGSGSASNNSSRPQRAASVRHLPPPPSRADSSSSTEYPTSTDSTSPSKYYLPVFSSLRLSVELPVKVSFFGTIAEKVSLLSRLFRRSGRSKQGRGSIKTFSAQFPPTEWFNSKAVHLHCVATQTNSKVCFIFCVFLFTFGASDIDFFVLGIAAESPVLPVHVL